MHSRSTLQISQSHLKWLIWAIILKRLKLSTYQSQPTLTWDDGSGSFPTRTGCFRLWQPLWGWRGEGAGEGGTIRGSPVGWTWKFLFLWTLHQTNMDYCWLFEVPKGAGWFCTSLCLNVFSVKTDSAVVDHQKVHRKWHKIKALSAPLSYLFNHTQVDALTYRSVGSSLTGSFGACVLWINHFRFVVL